MLSESVVQLEFYTLLRRHASEWNRAYNKCITYKHNHQIGIGCLVQAETYNNLADQIDHMTRADFKRWQFFHELEFDYLLPFARLVRETGNQTPACDGRGRSIHCSGSTVFILILERQSKPCVRILSSFTGKLTGRSVPMQVGAVM